MKLQAANPLHVSPESLPAWGRGLKLISALGTNQTT